jgi:hypothetical protein
MMPAGRRCSARSLKAAAVIALEASVVLRRWQMVLRITFILVMIFGTSSTARHLTRKNLR